MTDRTSGAPAPQRGGGGWFERISSLLVRLGWKKVVVIGVIIVAVIAASAWEGTSVVCFVTGRSC